MHERVFPNPLETLGVTCGKALPIPKLDSSNVPEVKELENRNLPWTFSTAISSRSS